MEVVMAEEMGFCFGVKRAIDAALDAAGDGAKVSTLGSIVHNPQVVEHLRSRGIQTVHNPAEAPEGTVVISSHGVTPEVMAETKATVQKVVDATCPIVRSVQRRAKTLAEAGFLIVIFGDPNHTEVKGVMGWAAGKGVVVSNPEDLEALPHSRRIALMAQTTQNSRAFEAMAKRLLELRLGEAIEISICNTICDAIAVRQSAAIALAGEVEAVVVVGGKDSANTLRLAQICAESSGGRAATYHIETADELDAIDLGGYRRVGVTAGASTPDWVIQEVVDKLRKYGER